jgi:hypothetical protein
MEGYEWCDSNNLCVPVHMAFLILKRISNAEMWTLETINLYTWRNCRLVLCTRMCALGRMFVKEENPATPNESARCSSVFKIWGFHGGDYEEWRNIPEHVILLLQCCWTNLHIENILSLYLLQLNARTVYKLFHYKECRLLGYCAVWLL